MRVMFVHRRDAEDAEKESMISEIPNLDAQFAEPDSNTWKNLAYVGIGVAASLIGILGASFLRGTWPQPDVLIAGCVGTAFAAWVVAKRQNDGWRVSTVAACFGAFFATLLIFLGLIGIGTTPSG